MDNREIVFTHRSSDGISVGAYSENGYLYIAAAFTNDGYSRNGNYRADHNDSFSRPIARRIIAGRIAFSRHIAENEPQNLPANRFTMEVETDVSARDFMRSFRKVFKPNPATEDSLFQNIYSEDEGVVLESARMFTNEMWDVIGNMVSEALQANASSSI